jgi:hypothetical protein
MIGQLLRPGFLRERAEEIIAALGDREARLPSAPEDVLRKAAEGEVTADHLKQAKAILGNMLKTPFGKAEREAAWVSRDPYLCILQAELERFYQEAGAVESNPAMGLGADLAEVTDEGLKPEWIPAESQGLVRQMEQYDLLGWGLSFGVARAIQLSRGKADFRSVSWPPVKVNDKLRLVLCADWASGLPRARKVAQKMASRLVDRDAEGRELHVINLGDTYYAGREFEYRDRLSANWPVDPLQSHEIGSWCLNGNHDMFTGGEGYFKFLDTDNRFRRQKGCSYFALENAHWLIAGLDTAWEEEGITGDGGGLEPRQVEWLFELRRTRPHKRLMLLSHHQLFSSYEHDSPLLMDRLEPLLNAPEPIDAWFWGHEHRCAVYEPSHNIDYPALIGHGGVPVFADSKPKPRGVWFEYKAKRPGGIIKKHAMLGFAVVDLDNEQATVRYVNEEGICHETHESSGRGKWKRRT